MRVLVIANPVSGGGRTGRRAEALAQELTRRGHGVDLYFSRGSGDATHRAGELDPLLDRLVVVGGDGTLNEVLNGLRDPGRVPLGILSTGTANLLARDLGLPRPPKDLADVIESGPVRRVDMGRVGARRFLAVVSVGFDALVTHHVMQHRSGTQGYLAYALPILRSTLRYTPPELHVRVDGGKPLRGEQVIVSNTRTYGGLFTVAEDASCDSGHLIVCLLPRARLPDLVRAAMAGLTGGLSRLPGVICRTGQRVEIQSPLPCPAQVDGDYFGPTPLLIELTPAHVPVVVPTTGQLTVQPRPCAACSG